MNGKRRDWVRNERPRDPQGMEPDGRGETDIMTLVARIEDLNRQAALELTRNQIQSYLIFRINGTAARPHRALNCRPCQIA
jgi:hypothetical protein